MLSETDFILLEIHANAPESVTGYTVVVLRLEEIARPTFNRPFYMGHYNETHGLVFDDQVTVENVDDAVNLSLEGGNNTTIISFYLL